MPTNQPNGPRAIEPRVGAKTDRGKVRDENQDAMSGFSTPLGRVYIVADGMGGHEGGAVAAKMVDNGFEEKLRHTAGQAPPDALRAAAAEINAEIHQRAYSGDPATEKMGSTAVLVLLAGPRMWIAHVGDSRAYLVRDRRLSRLTADHTRVQEMLARGILDEEAAKDHPDASILSRAFGQKAEIKLDIAEHQLQPGDGVLLCSDGLCGYAEDGEIEHVILQTQMAGAQAITDALIKLALDKGGEDNVTVQYLQLGEPASAPVHAVRQPQPEVVAAPPPAAQVKLASPLVLAVGLGGLIIGAVLALGVGRILWPGSKPENSPTPTAATPATPTPTVATPAVTNPVITIPMTPTPTPKPTRARPVRTKPKVTPVPTPAIPKPPTTTPTPKPAAAKPAIPTPVPKPAEGQPPRRRPRPPI